MISKNKGLIIDELYSYSPNFTANLFEWFFINSSTMVFHREVFEAVGLFDEKFIFCGDWEFVGRALAKFPIATVKKNLADIRHHDQNLTVDLEGTIPHRIIVAKQMVKFPEKYPPGFGEYIIDYEKRFFLEKGRWLAKEKRASDIPPSNE